MFRQSSKNVRKNFDLLEGLEQRRLNAAGGFDKSFDFDGFNTANFGEGVTAVAKDVAVQADGKTVVVGQTQYKSGSKTIYSLAVARFNVNGTLDNTFGGGDGVFHTSPGGKKDATGEAVAIQPDGKIVVAGEVVWEELLGFDDREYLVMRFNPDGSPDKSFGSSGLAHVDFNGASCRDMALQKDGKIVVVGGEFDDAFGTDEATVLRFNSNGSLDRTFDGDGIKTIGFGVDNAEANAVTIDYTGSPSSNPNFGKIVIAGERFTDRRQAIFARLNPGTGSLDKTFDGDGLAIRTLPGNRPMAAKSVFMQSNGKIVFAGQGKIGGTTDTNFVMGRLNSNGTLDTTFGLSQNGFVEITPGPKSFGESMMINRDGALLVAGGVNGKFAVAKYNANGVPDGGFGIGGVVVTNIGTVGFDGVQIVQAQGNRFVLAGGTNFTTARFLDKGANTVSVATIKPQFNEAEQNGSGFFVTRSERLPYATRVYFKITGSASHPAPYKLKPDYTCDNMGFMDQFGAVTFVDIPAGETFTTVTLRPKNDIVAEGFETAKFTVQSDANYQADVSNNVQFTLEDDDSRVIRSHGDGYVRDGSSSGQNFGKGNTLQVKSGTAGSGNNLQTYLKFDLSSMVFIDRAYLKLHGWLSSNAANGVGVSVYGANNNWTESTLNFNNKPGTKTGPLASVTMYSTNGFDQYFDVTNYLRAEKAAGRNTVTLVIRANSATNQHANFASRENDNGPQLVVT